MNEPFDSEKERNARLKQIIGLGEKSIKKNYYPLLLKQFKELKTSEEKYRRIVDTTNEGIWMIDETDITTYVNRRMAEMLGYREVDLMNKRVTEFFFEEEIDDHKKKIENRQKGLSETYERRCRHKNGQAVWTMVSATPLFDEENRYKGSFAMFTDITERKITEMKLKKLMKQ